MELPETRSGAQLIVEALQHSARVRAVSDNAVIAQTSVTRADADFDVRAFMESKFNRLSDPVGNTLTVGGNGTRFRQNDWRYNAGVRKKTTSTTRVRKTREPSAPSCTICVSWCTGSAR